MTYDYSCSKCGAKPTLKCSFLDRDKQVCDCGNTLDYVFNPSGLTIEIPGAFATTGDPCAPQNESDMENWQHTKPYSAGGRYGKGVTVKTYGG